MSTGVHSLLLVIGFLGICACEQKTHNSVSISYLGRAAVDGSGLLFGEFHYANDTTKSITSVALVKDGSRYVCLYPQFEYLEDGVWHKIAVFYAGAADPVVIQSSQRFIFEAPMESLYRVGQKQAYRILVDEIKSVPFSFELAKHPNSNSMEN